jgi:hypothetical protein
MNDVAKVLNAAADLIEQRGWTKNASARDSQGKVVPPTSVDACRWCATGAIIKVTDEAERLRAPYEEVPGATPAYRALLRWLGGDAPSDIPPWNDQQPGPEPVVAALRAAARASEG